MYSKCHSMYLKWTYFCNRHMGAIWHWESFRQNSNHHSLHDSSLQCLSQQTIFTKFMKMSISCLLKSIVSILKVIFSKSNKLWLKKPKDMYTHPLKKLEKKWRYQQEFAIHRSYI